LTNHKSPSSLAAHTICHHKDTIKDEGILENLSQHGGGDGGQLTLTDMALGKRRRQQVSA